MKVPVVGVQGVPLGKHKVRDPRLDQAGKLVKADTKTCASVDVNRAAEASTADAIVASPEGRLDLVVQDLDLAEIREGLRDTGLRSREFPLSEVVRGVEALRQD